MNRTTLRLSLLMLLVALSVSAVSAQSRWIVTYRGTETAGGTNKLRTITVTERTFIERCATNANISTENLALVLHFDADALGDALEVVNVNDPNLFRCEVFRLAFPESYTNNAGTSMKRFSYIYDSTSDHSRGSAVISSKSTVKGGTTNAPAIGATLHYWLGQWTENAGDPNAIVGSGTLKVMRPLDP